MIIYNIQDINNIEILYEKENYYEIMGRTLHKRNE